MPAWCTLQAGGHTGRLTSRCACASAMDRKVRLAGSAVGGVAYCDRLNSFAPDGVRMLRGVSSLGDGRPCRNSADRITAWCAQELPNVAVHPLVMHASQSLSSRCKRARWQ